nr:uncharacterized protein c27b12.07 [Quercus suber]
MAAPRLPFLWPSLLRSVEVTPKPTRCRRAASRTQKFHAPTSRRQHEPLSQRYGSANRPPPHLGGGKSLGPGTKASDEQSILPKIGEKLQKDGEETIKVEEAENEKLQPGTIDARSAVHSPGNSSGSAVPGGVPEKPPGPPTVPEEKPMETILDAVRDPATKQRQDNVEAGSDSSQKTATDEMKDEHTPMVQKAPHIAARRHVHHFDTYGLVKRLAEGGWSETQAITIMKSVRLMLADNMDLAREALISKSNVENETYLFRAACAELRTEVMSRRRAELEKMQTQRAQLQHEVDILGQRMSQESGVMKDELQGMFDNRKMAVRNEERKMESKLQQLNYKITVELQADARSEVEGLRWVTTRRVIMALGAVVVMVVGSLKLQSDYAKDESVQAKRKSKQKDSSAQTDDDDNDRSQNGSTGAGAGAIMVNQGENPGQLLWQKEKKLLVVENPSGSRFATQYRERVLDTFIYGRYLPTLQSATPSACETRSTFRKRRLLLIVMLYIPTSKDLPYAAPMSGSEIGEESHCHLFLYIPLRDFVRGSNDAAPFIHASPSSKSRLQCSTGHETARTFLEDIRHRDHDPLESERFRAATWANRPERYVLRRL